MHPLAAAADVGTTSAAAVACTTCAQQLGVSPALSPVIAAALVALIHVALGEYRAWRARQSAGKAPTAPPAA